MRRFRERPENTTRVSDLKFCPWSVFAAIIYSNGTLNNSFSSSPGTTGRSALALNAAIRQDGLQCF
jgi:hypothetical protein